MKLRLESRALATAVCLAALLLAGNTAMASDVPSEATIDANSAKKTVWPKPGKSGGGLTWKAHKRDLTRWTTISEEDTRSTPGPRKVTLKGPLNGDAARGKKLATTKIKGNCVACHKLPGVSQTGDVGPSLIGYKAAGKSAQDLYQQIYDSRVANPQTNMPPFGTFGTLTEQEIRDVVAYVLSLGS